MTVKRKTRAAAAATAERTGLPASTVAVERHAVVERSLEKYPWSRLSDAPPTDVSQIELRLLLDAAGEEGRAWTVSGTTAGRLPGPFEADLYVAICQLYNSQIPRDRRGEERRVKTTYAELGQLMNRARGGTTYKSIRIGLERLMGVEFRAVRTWRKGKYGARETIFHLLDKVDFDYGRAKKGFKAADGGELPVVGITITFSEELSESLVEGHLRVLDAARYFALETPTAKRLFRYLDQRRWFGNELQNEIVLAFEELVDRLPIERSAPSHVKRTLDPAHAGLIANGYLRTVQYEEVPVPGKKRRAPWVRYTFADTGNAGPVVAGAPPQTSAQSRSNESRDGKGAWSTEPATDRREARQEVDAEAKRYLIAEIMGTLRDDHSVGFYTKVVRALPAEVVRSILGGVRQSLQEGIDIDTARKLFTKTAQARAAHLDVSLSA
ncbi:MAG: replication initiator protein A [Gemmatimonadota bacterium]|nr:replication initiator protein A [Gemmatimonadota bacterium]